jgi:uncharacterized protein YqeY
MSLEEKINADIKAAMLAKDQGKLEAVRGIKSAILLLKSSGKPVTEDEEIKAMQKMVKQRKEAADIYATQNRKDLADVELNQIAGDCKASGECIDRIRIIFVGISIVLSDQTL